MTKTPSPLKLALGPILTYWPRDKVLAFYSDMAQAPLSRIYLGETTCSRRHELRLSDWMALAQDLSGTGKEIILSTQVLIESESDLKNLRKIIENTQFRVEVNDFGAVRLLTAQEPRPTFTAGYTLNVFNAETLSMLMQLGADRWVVPPEMSQIQLISLLSQLPKPIETEIFAYGRIPLAYSARCFTARHYNLQKDDCQFRCLDFADGLPLSTREGQSFLTLNGIQTQSARIYNLLGDLPMLIQAGVNCLRISPQSKHTSEIIALFDAALSGHIAPAAALEACRPLMPEAACNGFWHGRAGVEEFVTQP